jgi:hypothetical protein
MRALLAVCITSGLLLSSTSAVALDAVRLREVTVASEVQLDARAVRKALHDEVARVNGRMTKAKHAADVSVTVAKRPTEGGCELIVSAAFRDERRGALLGILEGRARTSGAPKARASDEALLRVAAEGALSHASAMLSR